MSNSDVYNKTITSPSNESIINYRVTGNYYLSFVLKGNTIEICFALCKESSLFCFKITNFLNEENFVGKGWIPNVSEGRKVHMIVPPNRPGFLVKKVISNLPEVESYSRIFSNISHETKIVRNRWSNFPVFYSHFGNSLPSIAFRNIEEWTALSVGDTPDRAVLNNIHMERIGIRNLENETKDFMERFSHLKQKYIADNALLSIFFSNSICLDSQDDCIMASKSPKYYVSAGFWARDFILWTLPVIERFDLERSKKLITTILKKYWNNKGIHALYLDGRILYDGFELDELSSYLLLLERALNFRLINSAEASLLAEDVLNTLNKYKDDRFNLYRTELNSSDDPVVYPYVTYNNVLLWHSLQKLSIAMPRKEKIRLLKIASSIKQDIMNNMIFDGKFCYSTDLKGNFEFYEDPTGSFYLFPYLGFINSESAVFKNTMEWISSQENKFWVKGKFSGQGNRHVHHPWLHWYVSSILGGLAGTSVFKNMKMDNGLACETIDENSGKCLTGIHFPGSSAFLVQAFLEGKSDENRVRKT